MSNLGHDQQTKSQRSNPLCPANTVNIASGEDLSTPTFELTPSSTALSGTPNRGQLSNNPDIEAPSEAHYNTSTTEYEGESSLFSHAVFATRFLQDALKYAPNVEVAQEMEAVLDGLKNAVHSGRQQLDALDNLYPHAKTIPKGSTTRGLSLPPMDKVFMCLRMARECPQVTTLWLGDYIKPTQFTDYFIKVASPGTATEPDLIIVHCGLYWLFCECSKAVTHSAMKKDYDAQASLCNANLQTVLANLRFHQPKDLDFVYAMGMAVRAFLFFFQTYSSIVVLTYGAL